MPALRPDAEALVTANLALVGHLARETAARLPRHLDTDDLIGAGALALVQAAHSFDPEQGVPFARFASTRIRGAMIDHMRQRDWATRSVRSRARALATVTEELNRALQREPTVAELAEASGLSTAEVRAVQEGTDRAALLSLDPIGPNDDGLGAGLADETPRPDEALIAAERLGYLRDAIAELPERHRHVVTAYYLDQRPLTEVATGLGVTQSRCSQIRAEGLQLLRSALSTLLDEQGAVGSGSRAGERAAAGQAGSAGGQPGGQSGGQSGGQDAVQAGGQGAEGAPDGIRARRRDAYVAAVARRSRVRDRADVQAYLAGQSVLAGHRPLPRQSGPAGSAGASGSGGKGPASKNPGGSGGSAGAQGSGGVHPLSG